MNIVQRRNILPSKTGLSGIIFWLTAVVLLFYGLGYRGLWTSEGRWAEIVREMFLTGDFFHPTINGLPYFDKPLLTYWAIVVVRFVTGELNEWTVRIPSAVSGLLALGATVGLGRRLWSEKVGRTAGWIMLTTYGVLFWSRTASADMENLATIIIAVGWYWARRERLGFFTFLVFYGICFLGAQTKGLTALVVPCLAVIPDIIRERRWRALVSLPHFLALGVGVSIYLIPFIYAVMTNGQYHANGLALVLKENVYRYFKPFDHKTPFYLYVYYLPVLLTPWVPLFLVSGWKTAASYKHLDNQTRWLVETIFLIFLFFTCSGSRRGYYILPILPFCALLMAVFLAEWKRYGNAVNLGISLQKGLFILASCTLLLSAVLWPVVRTRFGLPPLPGLRAAGLITGISALLFLIMFHLRPGIRARWMGATSKALSCIIVATLLSGGIFYLLQISAEPCQYERPLCLRLKKAVAGLPAERLASYNELGSNMLFYLKWPTPIQPLYTPGEIKKFINTNGDRILITEPKYLKRAVPPLAQQLGSEPIWLDNQSVRGLQKDPLFAVWHLPSSTTGKIGRQVAALDSVMGRENKETIPVIPNAAESGKTTAVASVRKPFSGVKANIEINTHKISHECVFHLKKNR